MADENGVRAGSIKVAPCLISDLRFEKLATALKHEWPVGGQVKKLTVAGVHIFKPGSRRGRRVRSTTFLITGILRHDFFSDLF